MLIPLSLSLSLYFSVRRSGGNYRSHFSPCSKERKIDPRQQSTARVTAIAAVCGNRTRRATEYRNRHSLSRLSYTRGYVSLSLSLSIFLLFFLLRLPRSPALRPCFLFFSLFQNPNRVQVRPSIRDVR